MRRRHAFQAERPRHTHTTAVPAIARIVYYLNTWCSASQHDRMARQHQHTRSWSDVCRLRRRGTSGEKAHVPRRCLWDTPKIAPFYLGRVRNVMIR